jgi:hypothetical protein
MKLPLTMATLFLLWLACGCGPGTSPSSGLDELQQLMTGSFSSAAQAAEDSAFFDVSLHMYPIWEGTDSAVRWLYVEQALSDRQEAPYRQRVYRLSRLDDGRFQSEIYLLPADSLYIGAWKRPGAFDHLRPEELILKEGCAVLLTREAPYVYRGSTGEGSCPSELRGASYATSEVRIDSSAIESWDRGFDDAGRQVWGAGTGGYVFRRIRPE